MPIYEVKRKPYQLQLFVLCKSVGLIMILKLYRIQCVYLRSAIKLS